MGYVKELNSLAKATDPSRMTVACSNQDGDINFITDLIVWQQAVGWESGEVTDLDLWQGALRSNWNHLRQAVCYGESDNEPRFGTMQTPCNSVVSNARQQKFHEGYSRLVDEGLFWGVWLNSMFDMGSTRYMCGVRNSGVIEADHLSRKDLYYLYKSQWNHRSPTLHIVDKERSLRSEEKQVLTVYSSMGRPVMTINGDTVACENVARTIYRTDTLTLKGTNEIKVSVGDKWQQMSLTIGNYLKVQ